MTDAPTHPALRDRWGASAALATPFDAAGGVDWAHLAEHARHLLGQGLAVVTAFGTTGEGASIPVAVRAELFERIAALGVPADRLVECVWGPAAEDAGRHIRRALEAGAAGILLVPSFYYRGVPEDGMFRWFAEVFEAAGDGCRDVILYNIPQLTGVAVGATLTGRLRAAFPRAVAGVKDSGGDWDHTRALLAEHSDLTILVGHEGHLAAAARLGASGAISGVANFAPALVRRLAAGEDDARVGPLMTAMLAHPVVPAIKAVLAARTGRPGWTRVRAPLEPLEPAAARRLAGTVAALLDGPGTAAR